MSRFRNLLISVVVVLNLAGASCPVTAEESTESVWPVAHVTLEDLRPLTNFKRRVPGLVAKGRVTGPAILRAHINAEGTVARTALLESCGNPDLDEASIHAMCVMQFKPDLLDGVPIEVTLVSPLQVPTQLGRSAR